MVAPELPRGFHRFHADDFVNYQLNRAHALGTLSQSTVKRASAQIARPKDVPVVLGMLADEAERERRWIEAAGCARVAEFFTSRPADEQVGAYERYRFQSPALGALQARALTRARVTTRVFTAAEDADQHCQMGNLKLATTELCEWLKKTLAPSGQPMEMPRGIEKA